tara:strand:+ start:2111 stop:2758 length:648 start_codon:yes stop_codon:yes gene_type:complete
MNSAQKHNYILSYFGNWKSLRFCEYYGTYYHPPPAAGGTTKRIVDRWNKHIDDIYEEFPGIEWYIWSELLQKGIRVPRRKTKSGKKRTVFAKKSVVKISSKIPVRTSPNLPVARENMLAEAAKESAFNINSDIPVHTSVNLPVARENMLAKAAKESAVIINSDIPVQTSENLPPAQGRDRDNVLAEAAKALMSMHAKVDLNLSVKAVPSTGGVKH